MKAITLFSSFIFIVSTGTAHAQSLPCEWAKSAGGTGTTTASSVAIDPSGNSFITGTFTSPGLTLGTTTLTNAGNTNIYLAKYDGAGNVLWAKSCKGNMQDNTYQVASDHSGNPIIAGYYESSSFIIGTDTLTNSSSFGFQHNFVAKFDPSGNLLWADHAEQTNAANMALAVDPSDNIFVAGLFNGSYIVFGADTLVDTSNYPFGNLFLVKYNSSGSVLWAICGSGTNPDAFTSLTTDPWGNLYVTGFVSSPVFTFGSYVLNNPGGRRALTAKISTNGNVIWAKLSSSSFNSSGNSITTDLAGNPYVTGGFAGDSIAFGTLTLHNYAYVDTFFNRAMFVVKYDTAGNSVWAKEEGFSTAAYESVGGTGIVTDNANNVYVTGNFQWSPVLIYGTDTLRADTANFGNNLFVAAYDGSGNLIWARCPSAGGSCVSSSIAINNSGALYICGAYQHGPINFGFVSLPYGDSSNAFIAKLNPAKTSVKNLSEGNDNIKVYPVPSDYLLHVSLPGNGYSILKIYDLSGREVLVQSCNASGNNLEYVLDLHTLAPGTYFVQAIQNGFKINRKIVIVRNG
jgi:hypothetical protein